MFTQEEEYMNEVVNLVLILTPFGVCVCVCVCFTKTLKHTLLQLMHTRTGYYTAVLKVWHINAGPSPHTHTHRHTQIHMDYNTAKQILEPRSSESQEVDFRHRQTCPPDNEDRSVVGKSVKTIFYILKIF